MKLIGSITTLLTYQKTCVFDELQEKIQKMTAPYRINFDKVLHYDESRDFGAAAPTREF